MSSAQDTCIRDLSILTRFHPDSLELPRQTLCLIGEEWQWLSDGEMRARKVEPFVFATHAEADLARALHIYRPKWDDGRANKPWALVRENPAAEIARDRRQRDRALQAEASVRNVTPSEAYERNCERMGERDE